MLGEKFSNSTGNKILIGILWENSENSITGGLKNTLGKDQVDYMVLYDSF